MIASRRFRLWRFGLFSVFAGLLAFSGWWCARQWADRRPAGPLVKSGTAGGQSGAATGRAIEPVVQEARQMADRLAAQFPSDARALHVAAQLHYQLGETSAALRRWEECLQLDSQWIDAQLAIGMVRFESGEFAEAERVLLSAFLAAPGNSQAAYLLASALLNQGKLDEAAEVLRGSLSIDAQSVPNQVLLGQVLLQHKQPAEARSCFLAATRLAPEYPNAWFGLATACSRLGQQEEAAEHRARFQQLQRRQLEQGIEETKGYNDLHATRQSVAATYGAAGRLYLEHGEQAEAERHWQLALQLDEGNVEARAGLAELFQQQNRCSEALAILLPLRETRREDAAFWLRLGQLYAEVKDFERADEALAHVVELDPAAGLGYAARAELRMQFEQAIGEAVQLARQACQVQPTGSFYFLLSVASERNGDLAAAREAMVQAIRLEPGNPRYQQRSLSIQAQR